jgi:hypothetical protein
VVYRIFADGAIPRQRRSGKIHHESQRIKVGTYPNHLVADATGTVARVESAFHVSLNTYAAAVHGAGTTFTAPDREPTLDAAFVFKPKGAA